VEATTARLQLRGLDATVAEADAERLPFGQCEFDFVWSWGVIHHSSRTGRIVREIARVLVPDGECRVMVYNRLSGGLKATFFREHFLKGGFLRQSIEESLYRTTDGFSARYYVPEQFEDLFRTFFRDVTSIVCGLDSDVIPLPGSLRRVVMRCVSEQYLRKQQSSTGSFIFLTAAHPV
jgi:SAM-dependent methyltransferase